MHTLITGDDARWNVPRAHDPADALRLSLRRDGPGLRLAPNFALVEFASRDGADEVLVHPALARLLQRLRNVAYKPVHITSGYRTPEHNAAVGGAEHSRHVLGMAADVQVEGMSPADVAAWARAQGVGGVGEYDTFTHLDVYGVDRRW